MTGPVWSAPTGGALWKQRLLAAEALRDEWQSRTATRGDQRRANEWLAGVDTTRYVGKRHHTVPRFLLSHWADRGGQVRVYRRIEGRQGIENVRDLAIKDFYTFININGAKDSTVESILGEIEGGAKPYLDGILSPFGYTGGLRHDAVIALSHFAAFQSVRTARHRREVELHAEWYAKTMAAGRVADDDLQKLTIAPHQNEAIQLLNDAAWQLVPFFAFRPLAVVRLTGQYLYICDEPVILNAPIGGVHVEDCFRSGERRSRGHRGKVRPSKRAGSSRSAPPSRVVHFSSTKPAGHGMADEIVLPISPSVALLWGPLEAVPRLGLAERVSLGVDESHRFASMANEAMGQQALDWIASRPEDASFQLKSFGPVGPLMQVCDGTNAASLAINSMPIRYRPRRLWMPDNG